MAFGQQNGRPATNRQVQSLAALLAAAGYADFRDARGAMGFTQRQAAGKFTADEAEALIEQLEAEAAAEEAGGPASIDDGPAAGGHRVTPVPKGGAARGRRAPITGPVPGSTVAERREGRQAALVRDLPATILARELERRGWILIPPEDLTAADPTATPETP